MIFFLVLSFIACLALIFALYPLRKSRKLCLILSPMLVSLIGWGYYQWGSYEQWQEYLQAQKNQAIVKKLMQTADGPDQLIEKLKIQLAKKPDSAKGWYLLGRLSASRGDWLDAEQAFHKARILDPKDEIIAVNYAQSLWQNNHQHFNEEIRTIFKKILATNPQQADALAMLAMDFYSEKNYSQAIAYWEQLLKQVPAQSEEAMALRKAIARAMKLKSNTAAPIRLDQH